MSANKNTSIHMPAPGIMISRCRPRAVREDFIVRGYGKRAVRVVMMANYNTLENPSQIFSEFELTYLLVALGKEISKRGWKNGVVKIMYGSGPARHGRVTLENPAGHSVRLGEVGALVEFGHFLNDPYYTPKGFWIQ